MCPVRDTTQLVNESILRPCTVHSHDCKSSSIFQQSPVSGRRSGLRDYPPRDLEAVAQGIASSTHGSMSAANDGASHRPEVVRSGDERPLVHDSPPHCGRSSTPPERRPSDESWEPEANLPRSSCGGPLIKAPTIAQHTRWSGPSLLETTMKPAPCQLASAVGGYQLETGWIDAQVRNETFRRAFTGPVNARGRVAGSISLSGSRGSRRASLPLPGSCPPAHQAVVTQRWRTKIWTLLVGDLCEFSRAQ